ncbi:hypothetical protein STEG23_003515, partial [Scotinomys teguina]
ASSPTTGTAPRSQSRLSVCPSTQDICRICHCEGDEESPLITPCRCTGTLRFVHQSCLHQWIKSSDTRCCELCKYDFIMETKLKPLRKGRGSKTFLIQFGAYTGVIIVQLTFA